MSMLAQALRWGRTRPEDEPAPAAVARREGMPVPDDVLLVDRLAARGARHTEFVDTRHVLCLPSLAAVRGLATELRRDGRLLEFDNAANGWELAVVQSVSVESAEILRLRGELEAAAVRAGGRYAGWEIVAPTI